MAQNTIITQCVIHNRLRNLIVAQSSQSHQPPSYSLKCQDCQLEKIKSINSNSHRKIKQQQRRGVLLCEESRQYFLQWTEGLINIISHLEHSHNLSSSSQKYSKLKSIFSIPEFLLNKSPQNIVKIFNAVLSQQIKLFEGNIEFISSQKSEHLNNEVFITDLYNIVDGSSEYSLNVLLQRFKSLIKEYYLSLGVKISDDYINRVELSSKLVQRLSEFKDNLLRKYSNILICKREQHSQPNSQRSIKSISLSRNQEVISVESQQYRESIDRMEESDVVEKKIVVGSDREIENSTEQVTIDKNKENAKKMNEEGINKNIQKMKFTSIEEQIVNTSSNQTKSKENLQNSSNGNTQNQNEGQLPKQLTADEQRKLLESFKTPKNQRAFTQNKQFFNSLRAAHCRTQKSPQKQQKHAQIKQSTVTKVHTVKSDEQSAIKQVEGKRAMNTVDMTVLQIIERAAVQTMRRQHKQQNKVGIGISSMSMNRIIEQMSIQNNNLKLLKEEIVKDVNSMDKAIHLLNSNPYNLNHNGHLSNSKKGNTNANTAEYININGIVSKHSYDALQKQYMVALHELEQSKHKYTTKSQECELLRKQVELQFRNANKARQQNESLHQQNRRLYHSQVAAKRQAEPEELQQLINHRQMEQEQANVRSLAMFNQQLIQTINSLQLQLAQCKKDNHVCKEQQIKGELEQAKQRYGRIVGEMSHKNKLIREMEQQLQIYHSNIQGELNRSMQLENTIEEMQKADHILREQISKINYELEEMLLYKVQSQFHIQKYQYELQAKDKHIQQITAQLDSMYFENRQIVDKYNSLVQITQVKENSSHKINQLFSELRENQNLVVNLKNRIKTMEVELEQSIQNQDSSRGQKTTRTSPKFHIEYKQSESQSDPEHIDLSQNEYEQTIRQLKRQIGQKIIQIESYNVKLEQLQEAGRQAKQQLWKLNHTNEHLSNCIEQLAQKYQNQIETRDDEIQRITTQNKENEERIEELMQQLQKFNNQNKGMVLQIERVHDQIIKNLNKEIEQLKNGKDKLQEQKKQMQTTYEEELQSLSDQLENLRAQNQQLNIKYLEKQRQTSNQIRYLQQQLASKQNAIANLSLQNKKQQQQQNIQNGSQQKQKKEHINLQEDQSQNQKIKELQLQIQKLNERCMTIEQKQNQIKELRDKVKQLSDQNEKLHQIIDNIQVSSEVDKYQPKPDLTSQNKVELERKIENLQTTVTNLQEKLKNQCSFDEQMMEELILTQSRLKSKQFQIDKILIVCQQMLEDVQENKKAKYQQIMKSWKSPKRDSTQ